MSGSAAGAHHEFDMPINAFLGEIAYGHLMREGENSLGQMIYQDWLIFGRCPSESRKFR